MTGLLKRLALTVVLTAALMNVMPALSLLERVPLQVLVFAVLLALLPFAGLALVVAGRNRSNKRAARTVRRQHLPRRLPSPMDTRWYDFDEYGRPW